MNSTGFLDPYQKGESSHVIGVIARHQLVILPPGWLNKGTPP